MIIKILRLKRVFNKNSKTKAIGSIVFNNGWKIDDLRLIEGEKGLFIAIFMPKDIDKNEFLTEMKEETRKIIENKVLERYKKL